AQPVWVAARRGGPGRSRAGQRRRGAGRGAEGQPARDGAGPPPLRQGLDPGRHPAGARAGRPAPDGGPLQLPRAGAVQRPRHRPRPHRRGRRGGEDRRANPARDDGALAISQRPLVAAFFRMRALVAAFFRMRAARGRAARILKNAATAPSGSLATSSSSLSAAAPASRQAQPLWALGVTGVVRALSLARESGWVLARDENHWLYLLNRGGERQAQLRAPRELTATARADDGSAFAAGGKDGDVWWLAPDLMPRWQRPLGQRVEALAVDPLGQYLAAADAGGNLSLLTGRGRPVWRVQTPRPLRFLT